MWSKEECREIDRENTERELLTMRQQAQRVHKLRPYTSTSVTHTYTHWYRDEDGHHTVLGTHDQHGKEVCKLCKEEQIGESKW